MVGYDDTPAARAALRWAGREAAATGATVIVAYAFSPVLEWTLAALQIDTDRIRLERNRDLRGPWTEPLRAHAIPYRTTIVSGRPGPALLRLARSARASCIVIGADRRHHLGQRLNGPVQRFVQHHARRPVISVPPEAAVVQAPAAENGATASLPLA